MDLAQITMFIQVLKPYPELLTVFLGRLTREESQCAAVVAIQVFLKKDDTSGSEADQVGLARLAAAHYYVQPGPGYPGI